MASADTDTSTFFVPLYARKVEFDRVCDGCDTRNLLDISNSIITLQLPKLIHQQRTTSARIPSSLIFTRCPSSRLTVWPLLTVAHPSIRAHRSNSTTSNPHIAKPLAFLLPCEWRMRSREGRSTQSPPPPTRTTGLYLKWRRR